MTQPAAGDDNQEKVIVGMREIAKFYFGPNFSDRELRRTYRWAASGQIPVEKKGALWVLWPSAAHADRQRQITRAAG